MKILFAGWHNPFFISITEYIEKALENLGHQLEKFEYRQFLVPGRLRQRFSFLEHYDLARINKKFYASVERLRPDLVFVLQGTIILPETISEIRKKYRIATVNWFIDYPTELENSLLLAKYYEFFFVSNTHAMLKHHACGNRSVKTLNFACYPEWQTPQELSPAEKKKYGRDVVFVGSRYIDRENVLNSLSGFDLGLWGPGWDALSKTSSLRRCYRGGQIGPQVWAKIFSAAKIVLNINYGFGSLPEEDRNPGSVKLFEILACGAFQMVDAQKAITDIFTNQKHLVTFCDTADLKNKIKYYLNNPAEREAIARQGRKEALAKHTYEQRMQEMLSFIKI